MPKLVCVLMLGASLLALPAAADHKLEKGIAPADGAPAALKDAVAGQGIRVVNDAGAPYLEIWLNKALAGEPKAASGEILNPGIPEGSFLGLARFVAGGSDFRGQSIRPGFYSLRYALMPVDGNHVGAAQYRDFTLMVPAALDPNPATALKFEEVLGLSRKASGTGHPAVFPMVSPDAAGEASLAKNDDGHWILKTRIPTKSGAALPIALTVVGRSDH